MLHATGVFFTVAAQSIGRSGLRRPETIVSGYPISAESQYDVSYGVVENWHLAQAIEIHTVGVARA